MVAGLGSGNDSTGRSCSKQDIIPRTKDGTKYIADIFSPTCFCEKMFKMPFPDGGTTHSALYNTYFLYLSH